LFSNKTGESSIDAGESLTEERKQREQLLELNHLIARQVMEKSRMVAGNPFILISEFDFPGFECF